MFSVVIPLYNKELSIKGTINSVLNQTFQNFEIVVVNDGSTDRSEEVVKSIGDDRIRLINQKNQGVSAARNMGIREARNILISFLDGDDIWEENHLEEVNKMINIFPGEMIYATSFKFSDNREVFKHSRERSIFRVENYFKDALKEYLLWTSIVVVNKICIDKVGGFNINLTHGEDIDFWARLGREYPVIKSSVVTASYMLEAENRSRLPKNIEDTHAYNFDLGLTLSLDENLYYKDIILNILYAYVRRLSFFNAIKLKRKHPGIFWSDVSLLFLKNIQSRIKK